MSVNSTEEIEKPNDSVYISFSSLHFQFLLKLGKKKNGSREGFPDPRVASSHLSVLDFGGNSHRTRIRCVLLYWYVKSRWYFLSPGIEDVHLHYSGAPHNFNYYA